MLSSTLQCPTLLMESMKLSQVKLRFLSNLIGLQYWIYERINLWKSQVAMPWITA
jgi:hypothetical protein